MKGVKRLEIEICIYIQIYRIISNNFIFQFFNWMFKNNINDLKL